MSLFLITSVFWIISEITLAITKRSGKTDNKQDRFSLIILWTTINISILLGIYLFGFTFGKIHNFQLIIHNTGISFILLGLLIRWIAILKLKTFFTVNVSIRENHVLVKTGLYKYIRHPAYLGSLISFFGLGLALNNWVSLIVIFFPILISFIYRISLEEKTLIQEFGEEYITYSKDTRRLVPGIY